MSVPGTSKQSLDKPVPSHRCLERIQRELRDLSLHPLPGILLSPDEDDICLLWVLIFGPEGTPFAGGAFLFRIHFPAHYPTSAPTVKFLTTDNGRVAFAPQLSSSGVVCPSPYGPWPSSQWKLSPSLSVILLTLQSIFNSRPLAGQTVSEAVEDEYNVYLTHETIRVAVCDALENCRGSSLPSHFQRAVFNCFKQMFEHHMTTCTKHVSGSLTLTTALRNVAGFVASTFRYLEPFPKLRERLQALAKDLLASDSTTASSENGMAQKVEEGQWFRGWRKRKSILEIDRGKENTRPRLHVRRSLDQSMRASKSRRSAPPSFSSLTMVQFSNTPLSESQINTTDVP